LLLFFFRVKALPKKVLDWQSFFANILLQLIFFKYWNDLILMRKDRMWKAFVSFWNDNVVNTEQRPRHTLLHISRGPRISCSAEISLHDISWRFMPTNRHYQSPLDHFLTKSEEERTSGSTLIDSISGKPWSI
jgi:hypothetical protein